MLTYCSVQADKVIEKTSDNENIEIHLRLVDVDVFRCSCPLAEVVLQLLPGGHDSC